MKTLSILLAIFVNPICTWFTFLFVTPVYTLDWKGTVSLEIKVIMWVLVLIIAALTFWNKTHSVMLLAELLLIITGVGSIAWGVHLSDIWLVFCSGGILTQGITSLWGLAIDHEHIVEWKEIRR